MTSSVIHHGIAHCHRKCLHLHRYMNKRNFPLGWLSLIYQCGYFIAPFKLKYISIQFTEVYFVCSSNLSTYLTEGMENFYFNAIQYPLLLQLLTIAMIINTSFSIEVQSAWISWQCYFTLQSIQPWQNKWTLYRAQSILQSILHQSKHFRKDSSSFSWILVTNPSWRGTYHGNYGCRYLSSFLSLLK